MERYCLEPRGIAMDTHEGTGILPKAACSRHPALAPSQFQRARLPESSLKMVFAAFSLPHKLRAILPMSFQTRHTRFFKA